MQDKYWVCVGGEGKGGILVRQGKATNSPAEDERLATGAEVLELSLEDGRLEYQLEKGNGPFTGWVSIKLGAKTLMQRLKPDGTREKEETLVPKESSRVPAPASVALPPEEALDEHVHAVLRPHKEVAPSFLPCKHLSPLVKVMNLKKFREKCAVRKNGELYDLPIPRTPEELHAPDFGVSWMTQAFQKMGTLPHSNSVKRVVSERRFEGGGSGPKSIFEVEFEVPDDKLATVLFAKFPWTLEENEQQKFVEQGQGRFGDNWGGEINFYRFVAPYLPFPVPALVFADMNRETSEAIIINMAVPWPKDGKADFAPYDVLPPVAKCEDYLLKDPHEYYFAIVRRQGMLAGLDKMKKLGPDESKVKWGDYTSSADVFCSFSMPGNEKALRQLVEELAPHIFPETMKSKKFLDKFEKQMAEINKAQPDIAEYVYGDSNYIGFQHQNGNTDNAYFYKRKDGLIECGLLDWGSFAHLAFASAFQGSFVSCLGEMLAEYDDRLVQLWVDSYHATGAPKISFEELLLQYRLVAATNIYGCIASARMYVQPQFKPLWDGVQAYNDEPIRKDFGLKFGISMMYNRSLLWALRGDAYWESYQQWQKKGKKGPVRR